MSAAIFVCLPFFVVQGAFLIIHQNICSYPYETIDAVQSYLLGKQKGEGARGMGGGEAKEEEEQEFPDLILISVAVHLCFFVVQGALLIIQKNICSYPY